MRGGRMTVTLDDVAATSARARWCRRCCDCVRVYTVFSTRLLCSCLLPREIRPRYPGEPPNTRRRWEAGQE